MLRIKTNYEGIRRCTALAAALMLAALAGCGDDQYGARKKEASSGPASAPSGVPAGIDTVYGGSAPRNVAEAMGSYGSAAESQAEKNRVAKADLYYKLDWARQILESRTVPSQLRQTVTNGKLAMRSLSGERGVPALLEALDLYDQALDLYDQHNAGSTATADTSAAYAKLTNPARPLNLFESGNADPDTSSSASAKTVEDPWPIFRSAGRRLLDAGAQLGLTRERTAFSANPLEADPFEHNPLVASPRGGH